MMKLRLMNSWEPWEMRSLTLPPIRALSHHPLILTTGAMQRGLTPFSSHTKGALLRIKRILPRQKTMMIMMTRMANK
jgi:hypothetical protein